MSAYNFQKDIVKPWSLCRAYNIHADYNTQVGSFTTGQQNAFAAPDGSIIYNMDTTVSAFEFRQGGEWVTFKTFDQNGQVYYLQSTNDQSITNTNTANLGPAFTSLISSTNFTVNPSTGAFTCNTAGTYYIGASVNFYTVGAGGTGQPQLSLLKNAAAVSTQLSGVPSTLVGTQWMALSNYCYMTLAVGDVVTFTLYNNGTGQTMVIPQDNSKVSFEHIY